MTSYHERFTKNLIQHSRSKDFNEAITEWKYSGSIYRYETDEDMHCICGHFIQDAYQVVNILNGNKLELGSECIKKISKDQFDVCKKVKSAYKKIEHDEIEKLNSKQIDLLYEFGYLDKSEIYLFTPTLKKHVPTDTKIKLNKIANRIQNKVNPKIPLIIEESPPPPYVEIEPLDHPSKALNTTYNIGDKLSLIDYEYLKEVTMPEKNKDFIENIYTRKYNLSEKQLKWLNNIIANVKLNHNH